ncbi:6239_t:CDS:1, partial [Funneliformis mosseae]
GASRFGTLSQFLFSDGPFAKQQQQHGKIKNGGIMVKRVQNEVGGSTVTRKT